MKKYLRIVLIIAVSTFVVCFFLYKATRPSGINQESNTPEILFTRTVSDDAFEVYTIGINGKNLNKLFAVNVNKENLCHTTVATDQTTVNYIRNNLDRFKDAFTHPLCVFSRNFYAYSMLIGKNDSVAGGACYKGVFLCNTKTNKTVQIDKDLIRKLPSSLFSKDGSLFVSSLSFSHDGKFLFVTPLSNDLLVFSMEQMKFTGTYHINVPGIRNVDKVQNNLYILGGTDSSNIFQFDMDKKELKPLTDCPQASYAISPDNKNLVFTETYPNGKSDLGILNLSNGSVKKIKSYPKEIEIAGFVADSKHLIVERHYKLSDTDIKFHTAVYLINLNTLKEAKIYAEDTGNE